MIPAEIRNQLIDYRNAQDAIVKLTSGNNEMYLRDLLTSVSLGYQCLAFWGRIKQNSKLFNELGVQQNIPRMVLTLDAAFGFKWLTEKVSQDSFEELLKNNESISDDKEGSKINNEEFYNIDEFHLSLISTTIFVLILSSKNGATT